MGVPNVAVEEGQFYSPAADVTGQWRPDGWRTGNDSALRGRLVADFPDCPPPSPPFATYIEGRNMVVGAMLQSPRGPLQVGAGETWLNPQVGGGPMPEVGSRYHHRGTSCALQLFHGRLG